MRLVILESPYSGEIERNVIYARRAVHDCLLRWESPIASHLLFTQPGVLDDGDLAQRGLGIAAGHAWIRRADAMVLYLDYGLSAGMGIGLEIAVKVGIPIEKRSIGTNDGSRPSGWTAGLEQRFNKTV